MYGERTTGGVLSPLARALRDRPVEVQGIGASRGTTRTSRCVAPMRSTKTQASSGPLELRPYACPELYVLRRMLMGYTPSTRLYHGAAAMRTLETADFMPRHERGR
jgi:hypothetical protein